MIDRPTIRLTWPEVMTAAGVAVMRNVQGMKLGRAPAYGAPKGEGAWGANIEGACGEMAFAKWCGRYWSGAIGNLKADDVGPYQVRTNTNLKYNDLRLHEADKDEKIFVSVWGRAPSFELLGWIVARDGKMKEYWRDGEKDRPAFWVPAAKLNPMCDFPLDILGEPGLISSEK